MSNVTVGATGGIYENFLGGETRGDKISIDKTSIVSSLWLYLNGDTTIYGRVYDESGKLIAKSTAGYKISANWNWYEVKLDEPVVFTAGTKYLISFYFTNGAYSNYHTALTVATPANGVVMTYDSLGMYQVERSDAFPNNQIHQGLHNLSLGLTLAPTAPGNLNVNTVNGMVSGNTTISWAASSTAVSTTSVGQLVYQVDLSVNNGTTWKTIADTAASVTSSTYNFGNEAFTEQAKIRVRARDPRQDSYGPYTVSPVFKINRSPSVPVALTPVSTNMAEPGVVVTLTPTLRWTFADPDQGNTQAAYQVQVYDSTNTILIWDSGKRPFADFVAIPSSANLLWDTIYQWRVKTWDNGGSESTYSISQFFVASRVPTVTSIGPGGTTDATSEGTRVTPRMTWTYSDVDGNPQSRFEVIVINVADGTVQHDSGIIASSNNYYDVPEDAILSGNTYKWRVTVWDSKGLSQTSGDRYIRTNALPAEMTLISPENNTRTIVRPVFVAMLGDDREDSSQEVKIQIAEDANFTINVFEYETLDSQVGWELHNGSVWLPFPQGGADASYEGKYVRYTMQMNLSEKKTYYWRMAPYDVGSELYGNWTEARKLRSGNLLQFQLKKPIESTIVAEKLVMSGVWDIVAGASIKVHACNNAFDTEPTWEDATESFQTGRYHKFTNKNKSADKWGVNVRVTVDAKDVQGKVEFDGFGFAFI